MFSKNYKEFINRAFINVTPLLKVKQLKQKNKRSRLKEFPYIVKNTSRISSTLKFFLTRKNNKDEKKMHKKLIDELLFATKNTGASINKKKNLYEYAFVKKKYFYYRWF